MKNLIKFFITATILFTASCTTENLDSSIASEETVEVFFATNLADSNTRAYDDGKHVNKLYYFVCDSDNRILNDLCGTCNEKVDEKFSFTLSLIRCMEYNIYLWAQYEDENGVAAYSIENGVVSINYANNAVAANNGNLDAFYGSVTLTPEEHGKTQNISLTRPFAQLNALTSDGDVLLRNDVESFENVRSTATVKGVYSQFDLINGDVVDTSRQTVTFASDTIPAGREGEVTSNDNYTHLSMNYLFVPTTQKCVADVQFTFTATRRTSGAQPIVITTPEYKCVPLKSNYKTNIIGKLLTDSTEFNVEIEGRYDYVLEGDVTLYEDLVAKNIFVRNTTTLNLNGHSIISGQIDTPAMSGTDIADIAAITIENGATLTIKDETTTQDEVTRNTENEDKSVGKITGTEYGVYVKNGHVVIEGGNISAGTSAVQVNIGTATINGGEFSATKSNTYVINCIDACWNNDTANVYIKGGKFHNFDPANNAAEGTGTNFCPEGYTTKLLEDDGVYEVIPPVSSASELMTALNSSGSVSVVLGNDIEIVPNFENTNVIFNIPAGTDAHLDLNGKKITIDTEEATKTYYTFVVREGGSLTIDGDGTVEATTPEPVMFYPAGNLVIENGTFIRKIPKGYDGDVGSMFVGTKPAGGWESSGVTINGGYFDGGYYDPVAAEVEEILAGTKKLVETETDITKRGQSGDTNATRKAIKEFISDTFNRSNNYFKVYGGTFVGANPAWGDEGCMLPTKPNYLRPWSYYQGAFIEGQKFNENGIVLPEGYTITKGAHEDGRPTYTVTYNK